MPLNHRLWAAGVGNGELAGNFQLFEWAMWLQCPLRAAGRRHELQIIQKLGVGHTELVQEVRQCPLLSSMQEGSR